MAQNVVPMEMGEKGAEGWHEDKGQQVPVPPKPQHSHASPSATPYFPPPSMLGELFSCVPSGQHQVGEGCVPMTRLIPRGAAFKSIFSHWVRLLLSQQTARGSKLT